MVQEMIIWTAAAPLALSLVIMLAAGYLARRRAGGSLTDGGRDNLAVPLSLGAAYAVGHLGLQGGPGLGIEGGLLTVTLGAALLSLVLSRVDLPPRLLPLLRVAAAAAAAWVLLSPLAEPQQWDSSRYIANLGLVTVAGMAVWIGLERLLDRAKGPAVPLALAALVAGSAGVVVMGGLAFTARLLGPLAAGLGALFLIGWRLPDTRLLRGAAPLLALATVSHWSAAMFYGELPALSLAPLVLAPLPLLLLGHGAVQRAGRIAGLAAALALAALPLAGAALPAAMAYFGGPAATAASDGEANTDSDDYDEDYGY